MNTLHDAHASPSRVRRWWYEQRRPRLVPEILLEQALGVVSQAAIWSFIGLLAWFALPGQVTSDTKAPLLLEVASVLYNARDIVIELAIATCAMVFFALVNVGPVARRQQDDISRVLYGVSMATVMFAVLLHAWGLPFKPWPWVWFVAVGYLAFGVGVAVGAEFLIRVWMGSPRSGDAASAVDPAEGQPGGDAEEGRGQKRPDDDSKGVEERLHAGAQAPGERKQGGEVHHGAPGREHKE